MPSGASLNLDRVWMTSGQFYSRSFLGKNVGNTQQTWGQPCSRSCLGRPLRQFSTFQFFKSGRTHQMQAVARSSNQVPTAGLLRINKVFLMTMREEIEPAFVLNRVWADNFARSTTQWWPGQFLILLCHLPGHNPCQGVA